MGLALLTLKILRPASVTSDNMMSLGLTDTDATDLQRGEILQRRYFEF